MSSRSSTKSSKDDDRRGQPSVSATTRGVVEASNEFQDSDGARPAALRGAAFFDRDGVLHIDKGYLYKPDDVEWTQGVVGAIRLANEAGLLVVVVTNQSGVARGLYSEADVTKLHAWMTAQLGARDARIDRFYHCPFHETAVVERYRIADHPDRKPNPGMLLRAIEELSIDPLRSFLIGDKPSDLAAGAKAGITSYLFDGRDLASLVRRVITDLRLGSGRCPGEIVRRADSAGDGS
jgi:D-glycero-D-manno-heptose 1,7-bisphosphate phosphatase